MPNKIVDPGLPVFDIDPIFEALDSLEQELVRADKRVDTITFALAGVSVFAAVGWLAFFAVLVLQ